MSVKLTNNATSLLATTIDDAPTTTTINIAPADAAKFPVLGAGDWCPIVVVDASSRREIMRCTARSGSVLTVVRGQESTTRLPFTAGLARVDVRLTNQAIAELVADASLLTTGLVADAVLPVRLRPALQLVPGAGLGDCNSVTVSGHYYTVAGSTNQPVAAEGYLWADAWSTSGLYQYQEWRDINSNAAYARRLENGSWQPWYALSLVDPGVPAGAISDYGGVTAPTGWLLCYGQAIARAAPYDKLFAAIGVTWGAGNGSTTFNVPDLRGRVTAGQDDMGGTSANRIVGTISGLNGDTLGAVGGQETAQLTEAMLAAHNHSLVTATAKTATGQGDHTHIVPGRIPRTVGGFGFAAGDGVLFTDNPATTGTGEHVHTLVGDTANAGSGAAHTNMQPTAIVNKIIKY